MAQDITGTNLATNAAADVRTPVAAIYFDWWNTGFDALPGSWQDQAGYLVSMRGKSRLVGYGKSLAGIGTGTADEATLTLRNPTLSTPYSGLRFSPSNAGGNLYTEIGEGKVRMKRAAVKIGFHDATNGDETVYVLVGYVTNLTEDYAGRQVRFELRDRAAAAVASRYATTLQSNVMPKAYVETIAALIDRDPPGSAWRVIDNGLCLLPYAWLDDEEVWKEMGMVAESQGGQIWYDHGGVLRFQDGSHFIRPRTNNWQNPLVSQLTFTVDDFAACNPTYNPEEVINHVIVEYYPKYLGVFQVVYTASETFIVPPGGSITIRAEHRYPVSAIAELERETDYMAGTAGGTDLTGDVDVDESTTAMYTELTITNNNAGYDAYIYMLQIRGYPLVSEQAITYEVENQASIDQYGRMTAQFGNPYVMSYRQAQALGDLVLARFKAPPLTIALEGVPGIPWLEPGDRVTVTEAKTGINAQFFVGEIDWKWDRGFTQTLRLIKAAAMYPYTNYFILGTSTYGNGGGGNDGRLFW
jgi:hypothetical protein